LSRRDIEAVTGVDCRHFCYPYGQSGDLSSSLVRQAGYYTAAGSVGPGWNRQGDDRFMLRRFSMPKQHFKLGYLLSGWASRLQRWRHVTSG
jgi:hypothetical protein